MWADVIFEYLTLLCVGFGVSCCFGPVVYFRILVINLLNYVSKLVNLLLYHLMINFFIKLRALFLVLLLNGFSDLTRIFVLFINNFPKRLQSFCDRGTFYLLLLNLKWFISMQIWSSQKLDLIKWTKIFHVRSLPSLNQRFETKRLQLRSLSCFSIELRTTWPRHLHQNWKVKWTDKQPVSRKQ